jgi:ligand-binding sensor domain-containing protein/signal transduction histidine kinase/CheY-like chemotaxis protein
MQGINKFSMRFIFVLILLLRTGSQLSAQNAVSYSLTVREGLIDNSVYATVQDKRGLMWFGTWKGLCSYDTRGFKAYKNDPDNPRSISSDFIRSSICDSKGVLWFGTNQGLNRYDPLTDSFDRFFKSETDGNTLSDNTVLCFLDDRKGNLWIGTGNGLSRLATVDGSVRMERLLYTNDPSEKKSDVTSIYEDPEGIIWVVASNELVGIDLRHGKPKYQFVPGKISGDRGSGSILAMYGDKNGKIWVGSKNKGIGQFDRKTKQFHSFRSATGLNADKPDFLMVEKMVPSMNGDLWLRTNQGLLCFDPKADQFKDYRANPAKENSVPIGGILDLYVDPQDGLWVGTFADGVKYMTKHAHFFVSVPASTGEVAMQQVLQDANGSLWFQSYGNDGSGNRNSTWFRFNKEHSRLQPGPVVNGYCSRAYFAKDGTLWLGLFTNVLVRYQVLPDKLVELNRYQLPPTNTHVRDWITDMTEDKNGLVVGTYYNGLYTFDSESNQFKDYHTRLNPKQRLNDRHISFLLKDSKDNLWIGTSFGIYNVDHKTNKLTRFQTATKVQESATNRTVNSIHEDSQGRIWVILSNDGLYLFDAERNRFIPKNQSGAIAGHNIMNLQHDQKGNLWLDNELGLVEYNTTTNTTRQYFYHEGIPGSRIMSNSSVKTRDGAIYMTTNAGAFYFDPERVPFNQQPPAVAFTDLRLFNKPVTAGDQTGLLTTKLSETRELVFHHDQSIFSIDFAVLNFIQPEKNQYAYKLEGLEKDWNYVKNPTATYTNLPAGTYALLIKGANNDGVWSAGSKLKITVLPPWWNTWYAWIVYILLMAVVVYYVSRFLWLRNVFQKEKELQEVKLNFFTNISHEIRTRLMLISGPVERLLRSDKVAGEEMRLLGYVSNSSESLLNLVNELMDFRKMESGVTRFVIGEYDLITFIKNVIAVFEHESESKNIRTSFFSDSTSLMLWYDSEQLQKVIYNLLANAYKFTDVGGEVTVSVSETNEHVVIQITDNGIGIAPEHLNKLFENYFQVDDSKGQNTGYGVGLALSKSIVERLQGSLGVTSKLASGEQNGQTVFSVALLKGKGHFKAEQMISDTTKDSDLDSATSRIAFADESLRSKKYTILLAEDNDDLRAFVSEALGWQFDIIETSNGKDAWEICTDQLPDLVISDVMMAEMDGLELCSKIKSDIRTSHIPVILLTARTAIPNQIEGLQFGADLYLTKPISMRVLELNIRNLLHARMLLQQKYSRHISLSDSAIDIGGNKDDEFLNSIIQFVEENIENKAVGVPELCRHVGMSKSVLYQKLRALTDMTINDFVKLIRFKLAARLLKDDRLSVQEVASLVGYDDRKYFSKEFKKQFGKTPSEYASEQM